MAINSLDSDSQGALTILLFLIFLLIHEKFKPYNYEFINNLKSFSFISTICMTSFAILASHKQAIYSQRIVFITLSALMTILFYVGWIFYFIQVQKKKQSQNFINRWLSKMEKKFKSKNKVSKK